MFRTCSAFSSAIHPSDNSQLLPTRLIYQMAPKVPQPGPARLSPNASVDEWLEQAKRNKYLPERIMKQLFELCKELLMEESNTQPVSTPVTICGDIHGQFYDLLELFRVAGGMPGEEEILEGQEEEDEKGAKRRSRTAHSKAISAEDIEPPTEIKDPKLRKKMRVVNEEKDGEGESSRTIRDGGASNSSDEDLDADEIDEEEERRGRPRTVERGMGESKEGNQGLPGNSNFIFMGDFVDRGYFSLETLTLLLCLKARYALLPFSPSASHLPSSRSCVLTGEMAATLLESPSFAVTTSRVKSPKSTASTKNAKQSMETPPCGRQRARFSTSSPSPPWLTGACCACTAASRPRSARWTRFA